MRGLCEPYWYTVWSRCNTVSLLQTTHKWHPMHATTRPCAMCWLSSVSSILSVFYAFANDTTVLSHERHDASNHQHPHCFATVGSDVHQRKCESRVLLALCEANPTVTGGFLSQRASNAELFSLNDVIMVRVRLYWRSLKCIHYVLLMSF